MNITIVGGGNVGTQFAVHCAAKKHTVTIFCSKADAFSKKLSIVGPDDNVMLTGEIFAATNDATIAFSDADIIFVTVPAFAMKDYADKIIPNLKNGAIICLTPGTGGAEFAFQPALKKGCVIMGLQRVPSVARLIEYGKIVRATGYRDELFAAAIPSSKGDVCSEIITSIFDIKCTIMPNFLNVTLTPSNPILHTTRLCTLFKDYKNGKYYDNVPLFYENWTDESSELLLKCDNEVQNICRALDVFDLSFVKSLMLHYESNTAQQLTQKIQSIRGFRGLKSPCVQTEKGLIPDFSSRYFTADFPYGLSILVQISNLLHLDCPYMQETLDWYYGIIQKSDEFHFSDYGINSAEDLINFYQQ